VTRVLAGLDSFAALNVMEYLSQLAVMGHTVIASIHQPRADIFNKFNKVSPRPPSTWIGLPDPFCA